MIIDPHQAELIAQDRVFLEQVRSLTNTARLALDEAEQYMEDISDPVVKKVAQSLLDDIYDLR